MPHLKSFHAADILREIKSKLMLKFAISYEGCRRVLQPGGLQAKRVWDVHVGNIVYNCIILIICHMEARIGTFFTNIILVLQAVFRG